MNSKLDCRLSLSPIIPIRTWEVHVSALLQESEALSALIQSVCSPLTFRIDHHNDLSAAQKKVFDTVYSQ